MRKNKIFPVILLFVSFIFCLVFLKTVNAWDIQNVCPDTNITYCKNVYSNAYNYYGNKVMKNVKLGYIIGVAWRPKGSIIGRSKGIPSAGTPESVRTSSRDAYYYIIDDGSGKLFLRQCREISPRFP